MFKKNRNLSRFDLLDASPGIPGGKVYVDSQTGVQYLVTNTGYARVMTVLVDQDGKPLIDKNFSAENKEVKF